MRLLTTLVFFLFINCKTSGQKKDSTCFTSFTIDPTLSTRLAEAKVKAEFSHPMIADGFWLLISKKNFADFFGNIDPRIFFDTLKTLSDVVCDCMIKKDTIYLQGGIAYEAGAGFDLRITGDLFSARIWVSGKEYRVGDSEDIKDEILLNSVHQSLKIKSRSSLRSGKKMIGELLLESEDFFEKRDSIPNKFYLKLLFGCKLDDIIVL